MKAIFFVLTAVVGMLMASVPANAVPTTCNVVADASAYYAPDSAVIYKFEGEDAAKVVGFFATHIMRTPPPKPIAIVYVGFDEDDGTSDFFFYGPDNCAIAKSGGWNPQDVIGMFDALGIHAPFGQTYKQIPGTPNAAPGFRT